MRRRLGIGVIVLASISAAGASLAVSTRSLPGAQSGVPAPIDDNLRSQIEDLERRNAQNELDRQAAARREYSGCTLWIHRIPEGVDRELAERLARRFREQAPVPADRVKHFRWLEDAEDVVTFVGWGAVINDLQARGDDLWIELRVVPNLESHFREGGIGGGLTSDCYFEAYLIHDGVFQYVGGRAPDVIHHEVRPWMDERVVRFD
jgi:hypothetical protein